jgi:hypothetical protein
MEFSDSFDRWKGHGNSEFRVNVRKAYEDQRALRLIIVRTDQIGRIEAGEDASEVKKEFFIRDDLVGEVVEIDSDRYVIRFHRQ